MTHNSNYLCTSIPLEVTKCIIQNAGALYLQPRSDEISWTKLDKLNKKIPKIAYKNYVTTHGLK